MTLPLYKDHKVASSLGTKAHAGLWFDKFCNQWLLESGKSGLEAWSLKSLSKGHGKNKEEVNPKLDWIQTVTKGRVGDDGLLKEHCQRLTSLARKEGGDAYYFKTAGRFATGLGREHPIENGFAWHPTLGTPYLSGSSVKGLVRAWAATWSSASDTEVARIFGLRNQKGSSAQTGSVIFLDAIPSKPVKLKADVMTPHYGDYYQDKQVPGDWLSPVPIPFLTVAPGETFLFALRPRTAADQADCQTAFEWLTDALMELGAGAKTAVGYGRFERDKTAEEDAKKASEKAAQAAREELEKAAFAANLANLSPVARQFEQAAHAGKWSDDKNAFSSQGVIEGWIDELEKVPDPHITDHLRKFIEKHFPGLLANPGKTSGKKNKPDFSERQQKFANRLNAISTAIALPKS